MVDEKVVVRESLKVDYLVVSTVNLLVVVSVYMMENYMAGWKVDWKAFCLGK